MNPALKGIWEHILDLGLGALAHANRHSAYMAVENASWHELAVIQAAHALNCRDDCDCRALSRREFRRRTAQAIPPAQTP